MRSPATPRSGRRGQADGGIERRGAGQTWGRGFYGDPRKRKGEMWGFVAAERVNIVDSCSLLVAGAGNRFPEWTSERATSPGLFGKADKFLFVHGREHHHEQVRFAEDVIAAVRKNGRRETSPPENVKAGVNREQKAGGKKADPR